MLLKPPLEMQAFSDGVCNIYSRKGEISCSNLRFQFRTVGIKRFYEAAMAQHQVDTVIRVPQQNHIVPDDTVELTRTINGQIRRYRYNVDLVQHIGATSPPVTDLTLRQLEMRLLNE